MLLGAKPLLFAILIGFHKRQTLCKAMAFFTLVYGAHKTNHHAWPSLLVMHKAQSHPAKPKHIDSNYIATD